MADSYNVKKITELTAKSASDDTDLYVVGNQGTATMRKISFATIAAAVRDKLTSLTFPSLNTSNKTLPGAVNELNSNMTLYINSSTYDDFYSRINALPGGRMFVFSVTGSVASIITGGEISVTFKGFGHYIDAEQKYVDFFGYEGTNKSAFLTRTKLNANSSSVTVQSKRLLGRTWLALGTSVTGTSDVTFSMNQFSRLGDTCTICLKFTCTSAIAAYTSDKITLASDWRPATSQNMMCATKIGGTTSVCQWQVLYGGSIRCDTAIPANSEVRVQITYFKD